MAYTPQTWTNGVSKLNATRLTYIENGLVAAAAAADAAQTTATAAVAKAVVDAKGDLLVATAADTVGRLAVGTNDQVLTADSAQTSGVKWATPATPASVPSGAIMQYGGSSAPTDWLLCDGSSVLRATYAALFTAIGTTYGSADGTHFTLPDLRGRVPVGLGTNAAVSTLANNDGVTVANRRPQHRHTAHTHTGSAAAHTHNIAASGGGGGFGAGGGAGTLDQGASGSASPSLSINATDGGSGTAADSLDAPAYLVVNYIIKT